MANLGPRRKSLSMLGGLIGIGRLIGIVRGRSGRRPTAAELMRMDDVSFDQFIRSSGLKTVSTLARDASDGNGD
jgi:hypothetical protein